MKWSQRYRVEGLTEREWSDSVATEVYRSPDSPTGYVVTFRCSAPAETLSVIGDWMLSDYHRSNRFNGARIWPHEYRRGLFLHTLLGLKGTPKELTDGTEGKDIDISKLPFDFDILRLGIYEMEKDEERGMFSCTIPLPSGTYNYRFITEMPDDNPLLMKTILDPNTDLSIYRETLIRPKFSQVFVPFDETYQSEDRSLETGIAHTHGKVLYRSYPVDEEWGVGKEQTCGIYLPPGYDEDGTREYPVLYLSHGGGDTQDVWFTNGCAPQILDAMIEREEIAPMIVVTMDNEIFQWDHEKRCIPNLMGCLIPYIENNYRVSKESCDRYFAGLSAGGFLAYDVYETLGEYFAAVGIWSGGCRHEPAISKERCQNTLAHVGAGRYDDAFFAFGEPLEELLDKNGMKFISCTPNGGHQWSVWRDLLIDFLRYAVR